MIRSYKCTQSVKKKHYEFFEKKCINKIACFSELLLLIRNGITTPSVIREKLMIHNKTDLRLVGSVMLDDCKYKGLNFGTLISKFSNSKNISSEYLKKVDAIYNFSEFIKNPEIIKTILIGKPKQLERLNKEIIKKYPALLDKDELIGEVKTVLRKIFNYESFKKGSEWNTHELQLILKNKHCLYCNIASLPEEGYSFDHFIPQGRYPMFGISLFNLIPSCTTCNTNNKKEIAFFTDTHIHPYFKDYRNDYSFKIDFKQKLSNIRQKDKSYTIEYTCSNYKITKIIDNSFTDLKLLNQYEYHKNRIDNVIDNIYFYSPSSIQSTIELIDGRGSKITIEEVYNSLFNTELDYRNFCANSYSRFVYDICKENKIVEVLNTELNVWDKKSKKSN